MQTRGFVRRGLWTTAWFATAIVIAGCRGKGSTAGNNRAETATCQHAPECIPAKKNTRGIECRANGVPKTCEYCGENGGLMSCEDLNKDGCLELVRVECGRANGCEEPAEGMDTARCVETPELNMQPMISFGTRSGGPLPGGYVALERGGTLPVSEGRATVFLRTRRFFKGPTRWRVSLQSSRGSVETEWVTAEYLDVQDVFAYARMELMVGDDVAPTNDAVVTVSVEDPRQSMTLSAKNVQLTRVVR